MTPDIESNHIVLAIWRGKLNIFWVTFVTKSQAQPAPTASPGGTPASGLNYGQLANGVYAGAAQAQVQLQQHWVEYFQGAWSDRISTDINNYPPINVFKALMPTSMPISTSPRK